MTILIDNKEWGDWGGLERINVDVDHPVEVHSTYQRLDKTYPDPLGGTWVEYEVRTEIPPGKHPVEYHISYTEEDNEKLFDPKGRYRFKLGKDPILGKHILVLEENQDSEKTIWNDKEGPGWRLEKRIGEKRKFDTEQIQRNKQFKNELLEFYDSFGGRRCALTGEACPEALEAAHIVPVKDRGQEVLGNGILLRADLHRIYDAGHFDICPETGEILVHKPYKSFDLKNASIPEAILSQIAGALRVRSDLCPAREVPKNPARRARR